MHCTGLDLDLAATAYAEGLRSIVHYFGRISAATGRPEAAILRDGGDRLLAHTGVVRASLARIDRQLWPTDTTPPPVALLAFYRGGRERWFVYYSQTDALPPAEDPQSKRTSWMTCANVHDAGWVNAEGRPITAVVADIAVTPRTGARPVPAGSIMLPPELRHDSVGVATSERTREPAQQTPPAPAARELTPPAATPASVRGAAGRRRAASAIPPPPM